MLGLQPHEQVPLTGDEPISPPPEREPFAPVPLRPFADIVADGYKPQLTAAEERATRSAERKEAEEQYVQAAREWCVDCDVLELQLQEGLRRVRRSLPLKGICYKCACKRLCIKGREPDSEGETDGQSGYEQDSVADGQVESEQQEE